MIIKKFDENMYDIRNFARSDMDWVNFSAEKKPNMKYKPGHPNFDLYIPEDFAQELQERNAKVTMVPPYRDGDPVRYKINIKINFDYYQQPEVYIREADGSKDYLDEETIHILDKKNIVSGKALVNLSYKDDNPGSFYANILEIRVFRNPFDDDLAMMEHPED